MNTVSEPFPVTCLENHTNKVDVVLARAQRPVTSMRRFSGFRSFSKYNNPYSFSAEDVLRSKQSLVGNYSREFPSPAENQSASQHSYRRFHHKLIRSHGTIETWPVPRCGPPRRLAVLKETTTSSRVLIRNCTKADTASIHLHSMFTIC